MRMLPWAGSVCWCRWIRRMDSWSCVCWCALCAVNGWSKASSCYANGCAYCETWAWEFLRHSVCSTSQRTALWFRVWKQHILGLWRKMLRCLQGEAPMPHSGAQGGIWWRPFWWGSPPSYAQRMYVYWSHVKNEWHLLWGLLELACTKRWWKITTIIMNYRNSHCILFQIGGHAKNESVKQRRNKYENIQAKLQTTFAGNNDSSNHPADSLVSSLGIGGAFTITSHCRETSLYNLFTMITNLGFVFMNNLQLWFAVANCLPLAKRKGMGSICRDWSYSSALWRNWRLGCAGRMVPLKPRLLTHW